MGSVTIIYIGRVIVLVTKYFMLSNTVGLESADGLLPRFFDLLFKRTGLYDSDMKSVMPRATAMPNSRVLSSQNTVVSDSHRNGELALAACY